MLSCSRSWLLCASRGRRLLTASLLLMCAAASTAAPKQPTVEGMLHIWGHGSLHDDYMGGLVRAWEAGFRKQNPAVHFENKLRGNNTALGGLYTDVAEIAFMDRQPLDMEIEGYRPVMGHDPLEIMVASGSVALPHQAAAPVVYVHRSNPLQRLTLAQLDAVLSADHRRSAASVLTWGGLGLTGSWSDAPITVYAPAIVSDVSQFVEHAVMQGSQKWLARLHEFSDAPSRPAGLQALAALARDPHGLAISNQAFHDPQVKAVALAANEAGPYLNATSQTVTQRRYPLTRTLVVYLNRAPGQVLPPAVQAFMRYLLGREGQAVLARKGGYLPLPPDVALRERSKLE